MRGGRVGFIENRARLAQHHHARRMTVLRELWYCHVAVLSFHASSPSNPPRFPCAYPFLSDFRGQFWRSSGTQTGSCGISSESSRRPLSNDIKFARIGVRTRELWLPEVGVSELFSCTLPAKIPVKRGMLIGEPRVPRRSRSHYLSNAPGLADQLVASRKDSAREGGSCAAYFCKVPDSRESELGLVRYGPASRVHRGVFGPFEGSFPIRIPADPDKFLAIREFHVVHGCVLFPMCPGSQINLLRVRKTLCASVATSVGKFRKLSAQPYFVGLFSRAWPCTEASLGSQDMILANGGRRNVPYAKGGGQFDPVFGLVNGPVKPWSNLVNLGQTWSKALQTLGNVSRTHFEGFWARRTLVGLGNSSVKPRSKTSQTWSTLVKLGQTLGNVSRTFFLGVFDADEPSSDQTGLVRAVSFCAPTPRENPGGGEGRFYRKPCTPRAAPSCAAHDGPARVVVLPRGSLILPRQQPLESSSISVRVPFFIRFSGAVLEVFRNSKWVMRHIVGKLSTSSFQRYKVWARIGVRTRELWLPEVGVSELFLCTFPMRIPVKRGMLSANREFHDVAGVIIFPTHPGSRINLLRAGKTLRAKAAVREKKCVLLPARFFSNLVPVPDSRESELGLVRYGPASRVHRGVFGPFEGSFPIRIPADPDKFLAIREFHVVHGCVLFPMCPGSQINLLRVRKTLCASVATSALHRGEFGFARYDPANGGRRNVPYAKGGGQFDPVFGLVNGPVKPWSNLVNLGQTWSNLVKALQTLGNVSRTSFQGFLGTVGPSRVGNGSVKPRSNGPSQTWSTLVKLGQTLGNVSRTFFLGVFEVMSPRRNRPTWFGLPRFACRHPRKSRG
uniref:Uncharacterized protein n=1 Tax=Fagus sylvatica TaxID=28930 RepID=A0A2N9HY83_FAGSY